MRKRKHLFPLCFPVFLIVLLHSKTGALAVSLDDSSTNLPYERVEIQTENSTWFQQTFEPVLMKSNIDSVILRTLPTEAAYPSKTFKKDVVFTVIGIAYSYNGDSSFFYIIDGKTPFFVNVQYLSPVDPLEYSLPVNVIYQKPELINGCEVTSLAIVLNYLGIDVDKCDLSDNYLPKSNTMKADPDEYYLNNPRYDGGFYCFAKPLIKCADNYAREHDITLHAKDLTNRDVSLLYKEIQNGHPVIVWGTLIWAIPGKYENGLYYNLHCLVLSGYTDKTVTIQDPLYGETTISRFLFEKIWYKMGQKALCVYK